MRPKKRFRRLSRFEPLENRSLLAGNVMVAVNSGELDITGDNANNSIQVTQLVSGQWRVTGISTKINGGNASFKTDPGNPVTGDIVINLSGGSDTLKVSNGNVPGALLINADDIPSTPQDGNDVVQVSNVTTGLDTGPPSQSLHITLGKGNNTVSVTGCTTSGGTEIDSDTGNSQFVMSHVTVNGGDDAFNGIFPGQGRSVISLSNVKWTAGAAGANEINLLLPGKTAIALSNVSWSAGRYGINGIFTRGPQSNIVLSKVTMTGGDHSKNVINPITGNSTVALANVTMITGGSTDKSENNGNIIETGSGKVSLTMAGVTMTTGIDNTNTVQAGDGVAVFSLANLNMTCDDFSENYIEAGNGTTFMALANLHMGGSDFSMNVIGAGNGHAVIALVNSSLTVGGIANSDIQTGNGDDIISLSRVAVAGPLAVTSGDGRDVVSLNLVTDPGKDLLVDVGPGNYDTLAIVNCTAGTEELSDTGGAHGTIVGAANHFATAPTVAGFARRVGI